MDNKTKHLGEVIDKYLRPYTFPVAVKLSPEALEIPKYLSPVKTLGHKIAVCQAVALVRRLGWRINYTEEDHVCPGSYIIFGYTEVPDLVKEGKGLHYPVYSSTPEVGRKTHEYLPGIDVGYLDSLFFSPVNKTDFVPDVVLVYGNAAQIVRLIQALVYIEGEVVTSQFIGRGACAASIVTPFKSKKCNVIIPGGGERLFALTDDTELLFSIPYNMFEVITEGITETHEKGVARIPTPFIGMIMEPQFPEPYQEVARLFNKNF